MNLYDSKILLVDDNRELAAMIQNILRRSGYIHVDCAESCAEGMRKFCLEEPQLVILDIMLPDGDGFSLFRKMREKAETPILFLSAKDEDNDRLFGLGLGAVSVFRCDVSERPKRWQRLSARELCETFGEFGGSGAVDIVVAYGLGAFGDVAHGVTKYKLRCGVVVENKGEATVGENHRHGDVHLLHTWVGACIAVVLAVVHHQCVAAHGYAVSAFATTAPCAGLGNEQGGFGEAVVGRPGTVVDKAVERCGDVQCAIGPEAETDFRSCREISCWHGKYRLLGCDVLPGGSIVDAHYRGRQGRSSGGAAIGIGVGYGLRRNTGNR